MCKAEAVVLRDSSARSVYEKESLNCSVTRERELSDNPGRTPTMPALGYDTKTREEGPFAHGPDPTLWLIQ